MLTMRTLAKTNRNNGLQSSWYRPLDRFFRNDFMNLWDSELDTVPSINIMEEKNAYRVEMAAPGLTKEDFNIDVDRNMLTISSEKESEKKEGGDGKENYSRREYNYSSFSRSLSLPENVDTSRITASYKDGILNLSIPKKEEAQQKASQRIKVE
jgi:HSP20 family protein